MHDEPREVLIRPARIDDLEQLRQFEQGVIDAERPFDPTLKPGFIRYYDIEGMLRTDTVRFLVAEIDGMAVGCGFARIEAAKPYLAHALHGYLGLMYVDPAHRGRSVNARIIEALLAWCRLKSIVELRLDVYRANANALRAYEKAGFTAHIVEMRMPLPQRRDA